MAFTSALTISTNSGGPRTLAWLPKLRTHLRTSSKRPTSNRISMRVPLEFRKTISCVGLPTALLGQTCRVVSQLHPDQMAGVVVRHMPDPERLLEMLVFIKIKRSLKMYIGNL